MDVVAIPIENYSSFNSYKEYFDFRTEYNLYVTEKVFILGFPMGYVVNNKEEPHAVWVSGTVARDSVLNVEINNKKVPAYLIDSRTRQGQSGSPVIYYSEEGIDTHYINPEGIRGIAHWGRPFMKEVGVYSSRINDKSDIGYVWKWNVISDIVNSAENRN